jgi:hypothetical protein
VVRANVPLTREPISSDRPYLGGSPQQIADDLAGLAGTGVDQVMFSNTAAREIEEYLHLLGELKSAADAATG